MDQVAIEELVRPLQALAQSVETDGPWGRGLVALRSPALFRHFWAPNIWAESVTVADHFPVRPLVSLFSSAMTF